MKNPLRHRIFREIKSDFGKTIALLLFVILMISGVSGFLVADDSLKQNYDDSFQEFRIEDGHFTLREPLKADMRSQLEEDAEIYDLYYLDASFQKENQPNDSATVRLYQNREDVNLASMYEGKLPENDHEIALDRLFAVKNNLSLGDNLTLDGTNYQIVGLLALSDYSALFKDNTEMMMDTKKFGVATISEAAFSKLQKSDLQYNYAWVDPNQEDSLLEEKEYNEALKDKIISLGLIITNFVPQHNNLAITFTGKDMGHDKESMLILLYLLIITLAFIFATTVNSKLEDEAKIIGVLRASGYTKLELLTHYISLPLMILLVGSIIGNILGYTVMHQVYSDLYLNSYSLTKPQMSFNLSAFILTTVVPFALVSIINIFIISRKLNYSIMSFFRKDFSKSKRQKKVPKLPQITFLRRFRLRVILENVASYFILVMGIILVSTLLFFTLSMETSLEHYQEEVINHQIADYQYVLKAPMETTSEQAEKLVMTKLDINEKEKTLIYGVRDNSKYIEKLDLPTKTVAISQPYAKKYHLKIGDTLHLYNLYDKKTYQLIVGKIIEYSQIAVFMPQGELNQLLENDDDYFNSYFSNEELTDLSNEGIASIITKDDYTMIVRQLNDSMMGIVKMMVFLAIIIYMMFIYLLAKVVIEKNSYSISMLKIMGYSSREVARIYNYATAIVVFISAGVAVVVSYFVSEKLLTLAMNQSNGWIEFSVTTGLLVEVFMACIISYLSVSFILNRKIAKIDPANALKSIE